MFVGSNTIGMEREYEGPNEEHPVFFTDNEDAQYLAGWLMKKCDLMLLRNRCGYKFVLSDYVGNR